MQLFKAVRSFRHQLILGLAISDLLMAVNFLSSCAVNLSGNLLSDPKQKRFCSYNGFMAQFFVVQSKFACPLFWKLLWICTNVPTADYWVLVIAVCTFLILA